MIDANFYNAIPDTFTFHVDDTYDKCLLFETYPI